MNKPICLLLLLLCGCPPAEPPAPRAPNPRLVESVATPDMVDELHRRETAYFDKEAAQPAPSEEIVPIVWERLSEPEPENSFGYIARTKIPDGWLVLTGSGDAAVIVEDPDHTWGTDR